MWSSDILGGISIKCDRELRLHEKTWTRELLGEIREESESFQFSSDTRTEIRGHRRTAVY